MAFYNGYGQIIADDSAGGAIQAGSVTPEKTSFMETERKAEESKNLYDADSTQWGYWSSDGVNLKTIADVKYGFTDYIEIFPNENISIKRVASGLSKNVFYYDANKNLLGSVLGYGVDPIVIADENAKYIRFNDDAYAVNEVWVTFPDRTVYVLADEQIPSDLMKKSIYIDVNNEKWRGKKIIVDGDSITDSVYTPWWSYLKEWFDLSEVQNCAASGKTIIGDRGDGRTCLERVEQDYDADATAIFLMGAGNGGAINGNGNADDTFEDGTFYGMMNGLIDKLQELFPTMAIALIATPPRRNETHLFTQYEQLKTIAANKRIYFIDCFHGTLNPDNADNMAAYIPDGIHPNEIGNKMLAQTIFEEMKRMGIDFA